METYDSALEIVVLCDHPSQSCSSIHRQNCFPADNYPEAFLENGVELDFIFPPKLTGISEHALFLVFQDTDCTENSEAAINLSFLLLKSLAS